MSFLSELKKQKQRLKETETVVTNADGRRFVEKFNDSNFELTVCSPSDYGFVVDTKPDDVPVLIIGYLYLGSQDCATPNVLKNFNIKNVLSLGIEVVLNNVICLFVPSLDLPETDVKPILNECLPFINKCLISQENVLVHCNAGVSRAAMVVIAYLMCYENKSYIDAYNLVKSKRPAIQPNAGFVRQLKLLQRNDLNL